MKRESVAPTESLLRYFPQISYDGFVKSSNSRRANFTIMRRTYRTLNDCEMQHNTEVGLFTKSSAMTTTPAQAGIQKTNARIPACIEPAPVGGRGNDGWVCSVLFERR